MFPHLESQSQFLERKGLVRKREAVRNAPNAKVYINSQEYVNFCSNDYLGLGQHPKVKEVIKNKIGELGFGSGSSPLLSGYSPECKALEEKFCDVLGYENALVFPSGYQANIGVVSALVSRESTVVCDALCHASILDGMILSRSKMRRYRHNDVDHAQALVEAHSPCLLITESVFSMEGTLAPLVELRNLSRCYDIPFFVDDAHGFGVLGESGRGAIDGWETKNVKPDILAISFGKALGASGAIVLSSDKVMGHILQYCRSYRYTTALPPLICLSVLESLNVMEEEKWRLQNLRRNIRLFNQYAKDAALPLISQDITPVRSILIGDNRRVLEISGRLKERGFYVAAIRPPAVPENMALLRSSLHCDHTESDIIRLIASLKEALP